MRSARPTAPVLALRGLLEKHRRLRPQLPRAETDIRLLLDTYVIEQALEEMGRELSERPEWVRIPQRVILRLLETPAG